MSSIQIKYQLENYVKRTMKWVSSHLIKHLNLLALLGLNHVDNFV